MKKTTVVATTLITSYLAGVGVNKLVDSCVEKGRMKDSQETIVIKLGSSYIAGAVIGLIGHKVIKAMERR